MFSLLEGNTSLLITRRQFVLYHLVCLASQDISSWFSTISRLSISLQQCFRVLLIAFLTFVKWRKKCKGPFTGIIGSTWSFSLLYILCYCIFLYFFFYRNVRTCDRQEEQSQIESEAAFKVQNRDRVSYQSRFSLFHYFRLSTITKIT